jgi:undecaprenyl-diphosphatase
MSLDVHLAETANSFAAHHDGWEDAARWFAHVSEPLFIALVIVLAAAGLLVRRPRVLAASVLAVLAAGASLVVAAVLAHVVDRPRPFVAHPQIHAFLSHAADPGFPSDHATAAFAIAAAIFLRKRGWGIAALVAATVLSVGRVALGVHYPSDVLAGAALGSAAALVLWAPPLRSRIDRLADVVGARWDRSVARVAALVD